MGVGNEGAGHSVTSYAVVLTHNRPELLDRCIAAISPQVDRVHVVDNASDPPMRRIVSMPGNMVLFEEPMQPPNLAVLWNQQIDLIEKIETNKGSEAWEIAFLCDDAIVPEHWFITVKTGLRAHRASAGSTGPLEPRNDYLLKAELDGNVYERMCGWAFVLAGEKGLRADETMHWWFVDSDLDYQARRLGGTIICPGPSVPNELPGAWTNAKPELGTRAGLDRQAFNAKWNVNYW